MKKSITDFEGKDNNFNELDSFSKTDACFLESVRQAALYGGLPFSIKEINHGKNRFNEEVEELDDDFIHSVRYGRKNTLDTLSTRMPTISNTQRL